jgi:Regulator of chromosome condensation (RCC1) repeat
MRTRSLLPVVLVSSLVGTLLLGAAVPAGAAGPAAPTTWGSNGFGELGDGTTTRRTSPVAVPGLAGVETVTAGRAYSVAL